MQPIEITYAGRRAALSFGEEILLAPHIAVLEQGHPDRVFVALLCVWAREVVEGGTPGLYRDDTAHVYARSFAMPTREFWPRRRWADHQLAEYFCVPLPQIRQRRAELERETDVQRAPGAEPGAL